MGKSGKHGNGWVSHDCEKVVIDGLERAANRIHSPEAQAAVGQLGQDLHRGTGAYDVAGLVWGVEGMLDKLTQSKDPQMASCAVNVQQDITLRGATNTIHNPEGASSARPQKGHRPGG